MAAPSIPDLAQRQRERAPLAMALAAEKLEALDAADTAGALVAASQRASTLTQRVVWLQRAASAWARPLEPVSACRKGCAHCCHIAVTISRVEATLISRATGRALAVPRSPVRLDMEMDAQALEIAQARLQQLKAPSPCPFLKESSCSVYEQRPIACRVLINLDDDDLLCRHVQGEMAAVPYADARSLKALALSAQASSEFADIRDFFPGSITT